MKHGRLFLLAGFLTFTVFAYAQETKGDTVKAGIVNRWDVGIAAGADVYAGSAGFKGMLDTRAYLVDGPMDTIIFAGAGALIQSVKSSYHAMTNLHAYALGGLDWFMFKAAPTEALRPLAWRAQIALGGGLTSDTNSDGTKLAGPGLLLLPSIGADYAFGKLHANVMFGFSFVRANAMWLSGFTTSLGVSYSILERGEL